MMETLDYRTIVADESARFADALASTPLDATVPCTVIAEGTQ